jgi:peptidoglycan glycosyltransferase
VRVNAIQNAMVVAAVANGGVLMQPSLVDSVIGADLSVLDEFEPAELGRPISAATSSTMVDMLVDGVSNGAANGARIDGVAVGGKTGTGENGPGEPFNLWFSGFAPADNPRVAVSVVVGDGGGRGQELSGNALAAPIARQVMEAVLNQ